MSPVAGQALLRWAVFVTLLSGAGLLAARPGTAGYVLSAAMLCCGVATGILLAILVRVRRQ